jgi:hypothetical protein
MSNASICLFASFFAYGCNVYPNLIAFISLIHDVRRSPQSTRLVLSWDIRWTIVVKYWSTTQTTLMSIRNPYHGLRRKLVLAFDVGTTYSGVSYSVLDPGVIPQIKGVTRYVCCTVYNTMLLICTDFLPKNILEETPRYRQFSITIKKDFFVQRVQKPLKKA